VGKELWHRQLMLIISIVVYGLGGSLKIRYLWHHKAAMYCVKLELQNI
jgi:hypothetical protein